MSADGACRTRRADTAVAKTIRAGGPVDACRSPENDSPTTSMHECSACSALATPGQEVWFAWNAKAVVRQYYDHTDPELADARVAEIGRDFTDASMPVSYTHLT